MKFLIQTVNGHIVHDFSFELLRSIEYQDWLGNPIEYQTVELSQILSLPDETFETHTPIGTVEFVGKHLQALGLSTPPPRNVPMQLKKYAGRHIYNGCKEDMKTDEAFVKDHKTIKGLEPDIYEKDELPDGYFQFSEPIEIFSEYRCFVYKDELVGIQHYSGDFTIPFDVPAVQRVVQMISNFKDSPVAYTLDMGNIQLDIPDYSPKDPYQYILIEVHDFFSCGLYGFSDYRILPHMFNRWFNEYKSKQS